MKKDTNMLSELQEYLIDFTQRYILFWDVLRERGNQYIEHNEAGSPPVLIFDYEVIVDGRTLENPVNYSLVEIIPPKDVKIDKNKRPFLIIDPRSGHGAGIGGFKDDSQVGVALQAGYPVYFVIFYQEPEPNQTLRDVAVAEKLFSDTVKARHPNSPKPCIIGNCQGGWAVMMLAAVVPDLAGVLVINGAPLSYWAGENGKNPLRYAGGMLGGSWFAQFVSDLGNGRFDGANLVMNFESLNPANKYWKKNYNLFSNIDDERTRFLDFEKWWGGFYLMNTDEIKSILDNLFIGNYLTHGKIHINQGHHLDLRKIRSPIIIFCSEGDNITPPQQALHWIADIYHDDLEIKEAEQTIIYMIHSDIGHLGLFVSASVAVKEHKEIVGLLEYVEILPPGLYEMIIQENPKHEKNQSQYQVILEERSINDILERSPQANSFERDKNIFSAVRTVSKYNALTYDIYFGWMVRLLANEKTAELLRQLHPLRVNRYMISDLNPAFKNLAPIADSVRKQRMPVNKNNMFLKMQNDISGLIESTLNNYRDIRDDISEAVFYKKYSFLAMILQDMFARENKSRDLKFDQLAEQTPHDAAEMMMQGDSFDAIVRVLLLIVKAQGFMKGAGVANTRELLIKNLKLSKEQRVTMREKIHTQGLLVAYDAEQAVATLPKMLTHKKDREFVVKTLRDLVASLPQMGDVAKQTWIQIEQLLLTPVAAPKKLPKPKVELRTKTKPKAPIKTKPKPKTKAPIKAKLKPAAKKTPAKKTVVKKAKDIKKKPK
jgi:pimeloyl-ACP methyl ester carboxylesterase